MAMATEYPVEVYESHLKQHEFLFFVGKSSFVLPKS